MKKIKDNSISLIHPRFGHRCYTFQTPGVIHYDPQRGKKIDPYWCIIEADKELTRYYRAQFKTRYGIELYPPSFDAHVSLLRGEAEHTPKMDTQWGFFKDKEVEIWYDSNIYWNNQHVWLNTYCEQYFDIREFYDVRDWNTKDFGHLTIGKFKP